MASKTLWKIACLVAAGWLIGAPLPALSQPRPAPNPSVSKPSVSKPAAPAPSCDAAKFRVIVDVGHTPEIPGAISARGATEYDYNLQLAKVVERKLQEAGFARTQLLLATGPAIPSLVTRISQANRMSADLLISIHHDSVPEAFKVKWEYEGKALEYSDRFRGHSIFVSIDNADFNGSLVFAKLLGARLKAHGLQYTPHYTQSFMGRKRRQLIDAETGVYRFDQLMILRGPRMPSVLLEAGSIVHRDEEIEMGKDERRLLIAGAIIEAVETFCAARAGRRTQRAAH